MNERVTDLEVRLAYLEKIQEEQNQVIYGQQKIIDKLSGELEDLRGRVVSQENSSGSGNASAEEEPPPPHY